MQDIQGGVLVISQFTLAAGSSAATAQLHRRGGARRRAAALRTRGEQLRAGGVEVATGQFGASMQVELVNDGR